MKRDLDLIRKVLLFVEAAAEPVDSKAVVVDGYPREEIDYSIYLLLEEDCLTGKSVATRDDRYHWLLLRLTWGGHEFLDAARSDTVWVKATSTIGQQLGNMSLEIVKAALVDVARRMVNLP